MKRRAFAGLLGATLVPLRSVGAQGKSAKIGFIEPGTPEANGPFLTAFRTAMAALGWKEGQNLTILDRWLANRPERIPEVVAGLVAETGDVLVAAGSLVTRGTIAAAPRTPIVMVGVSDPVGFGFARSLSRPGGFVTGVTNTAVDLLSKRLQMLAELAPAAKRIAVLTDSNDPTKEAYWVQVRDDAAKLGMTALQVTVTTADDIEREIPRLPERADAIFVAFNALMIANRTTIATLARSSRLPTSCPIREFVVAGGLQSLGSSLPNEFRRAVPYVDRILRGAKPADLPIEQPTNLELSINMKTAKALGLTVPPALLARADEVIE